MKVSLKSGDTSRLLKLISDIEGGQQKALYRTLKATQAKMKTEASKQIRNAPKHGLNLTKKYVDSKLKAGAISYTKMEARLSAEKRGVLMTRFPYSVTSKGVRVKIKRKASRKFIKDAFVMPRLKNSHVPGIAVRKNNKLDVLHSPSISQALDQVLQKTEFVEQMSTFAIERLSKEVETILRRAR